MDPDESFTENPGIFGKGFKDEKNYFRKFFSPRRTNFLFLSPIYFIFDTYVIKCTICKLQKKRIKSEGSLTIWLFNGFFKKFFFFSLRAHTLNVEQQ